MPPTANPIAIADVFRQYSRLYELRNTRGGDLDPGLEGEWMQVSFTLESIFSGMYQSWNGERRSASTKRVPLRDALPVNYLRVPADSDVLCETTQSFFSGKLIDISTGGAYLRAPVPLDADSRLRLTFCTSRMPIEIEGRVAWNNPGRMRKRSLPAGAGVQFMNCDQECRRQLRDYVYELLEDTLSRANLI
ncbi:MAG: PilZ domain-containing protein [Acidobacteriota bacterium]